MKKFYLLLMILFLCSSAWAYEITCPKDITTVTDKGVCTALVSLPRPDMYVLWNTQLLGLYYELSGATFGTGMYPATGPASVTFNKGVTTVKLIQKYRDWMSVFWYYWYAECRFTVTVADNQKPSITCPGNAEKLTDTGLCTFKITGTDFDPVSVSDNCPGVTVKNSFNNSSTLKNALIPKGTTTIVWTATDNSGIVNTCSFTFKVSDSEKPWIQCPGDIVKNNDPGKCGAVINYAVNYTDNCPGATLTQTSGLPSGSLFPVGETTNCYKVTDAAGNTETCCFKVTVTDNEKPTIQCPGNMTVATNQGKCSAVVNYTVNYNDNCPDAGLKQTAGLPSGAVFPKGTTTNTYEVKDAKGLTASCSFTVTVVDKEPPVIGACGLTYKVYLHKSGLFKCFGELNECEIASTIKDNCSRSCCLKAALPQSDGCITVLFSRTSFYVPGVYPVTVKATDMSGNTSSCVIRVEACYSNSIQTAPLKSGEIGVEPRFITDISVYPNPTEGLFSLDVSNLKNQEVYVRIFNSTLTHLLF
jgi:hypothetical protein